jgi:DNA mismatch repair protein MutS2
LIQKLTDRSLRALEYDHILELLSAECSCEASVARALSLVPYSTPEDAMKGLQESEDACRLVVRFGGPSFSGLKNIESALHRAAIGSSLQAGELLQVAAALAVIRALKRYRENTGGESTCLDDLFDRLAPNKFLEDEINSAIKSEEEIADSASPALSDIRRHIKRAEAKVREQLDKMIRSPTYQKYLQEPIVTIRSGRFVVPVKTECRGDVPGLIHDTSSSGATVFVEPMPVVEANNELRILYSKEEKEIERILAQLSAEVGEFAESISQNMRAAEELDFIFAKARLSFKMKASAPKLGSDGVVELHKARHPLLDVKTAVPVDISLGGNFDTLVVTGPNTGGKTVALKSLGLLTLMAMSGLMIPAADDSRLSFFESVLADIGDEQSIEQSLSTFSSHMTNITDILGVCGRGSLVLLDELGSGTDPVEGAALAVSILEYLKASGAKTAATTHYAELKIYALETPRVENACCEFDVMTLKPTFKLLIGVPGRSNAFAISERLGLPGEIVERAKELVSSENSRFEEVVQGLELSRQQMEQEKERAGALRLEAERAGQEAEKLRRELAGDQEKEFEKARAQARRIVEQSRAQAQALLNELDELRKMRGTEDIAALRELARSQINLRLKGLEQTADPVKYSIGAEYKLPRPLRVGDTVIIDSINKKGNVLSLPDSQGYVELQAGIIRTRVQLSNLRLVEGGAPDASKKASVRTNIDRSKLSANSELDLRGYTVEEGLIELDRFIDNALLSNLGQVAIIHGKGTGALRSAVQQHLKGHHAVKTFRLGRYGEGESGVTIIELN